MSLPRLRLERSREIERGCWLISAEEAHHLTHVRRCRDGSLVEGLLPGRRLVLRLVEDPQGLLGKVEEERTEKADLPEITLCIALLKAESFDLLLRQATETGVTRIVPLACDRSVVRLDGARLEKKLDRWRRILEESTKQCGAATPPELTDPVSVEQLEGLDLPPQRLVAAIDPDNVPLGAVVPAGNTVVAIGPEGDWSPRELDWLGRFGFQPVSLGPRILKAFTAAAVCCAWLTQAWIASDHDASA